MATHQRIDEALEILTRLGFPRAQQNQRSALSLLALLDLTPERSWSEATNPLVGITPIMEWISDHYQLKYAPNTRETVRRQTMHQFVAAGLALYNPDDPDRPVNSPNAVYQIEPTALALIRKFRSPNWERELEKYLEGRKTLTEKFARQRNLNKTPVQIPSGKTINLSPGAHSLLIKQIIEEFAPRFIPGAQLLYVGDTGDKWAFFDENALANLGVRVDAHGKMPDVALFDSKRNWLFLVESVTSHGPVDGKRHEELASLFKKSNAGVVFVTAFPDRAVMARYLRDLAWETEVWVADSPTHMIHLNGPRFLGPY